MSRRLSNYLRTFRKRSGLSQADVAYLLGCRDGAKVSRYERSSRRPGLKTTLAFEAVFQGSACDLFAGLYQEIKAAVQGRARTLISRLEARSGDRLTARKLSALRAIVDDRAAPSLQ